MLDPSTMAKIEDFDQKLKQRLDDKNFVLAYDLSNYAVGGVNRHFCKPYLEPAYGDATNTPTYAEYDCMGDEFRTFMDAQGNMHTVDDNTQNIDISEP